MKTMKMVGQLNHEGDDLHYPHEIYNCSYCKGKPGQKLILLEKDIDEYGYPNNKCICEECMLKMADDIFS